MAARIPVQIPVLPWFRDHSFNGTAIFPAVESMLLLADIAVDIKPALQPQNMLQGSFSKLLEIPEGVNELSVLVEYEEKEDTLFLKLLSKIQFKKISRIKEHAALSFAGNPQTVHPLLQGERKGNDVSIDGDRIYRELVPFGPSYRSIIGRLHLQPTTALARLQAPLMARKQEMEDVVGSPFPLDGAMHAACVLGQCVADFVPFPVAFEKRFIHRATKAGEEYAATVHLLSKAENELIFDLSIFDSKGEACETVKGLRMRDVSGGLIKPAADLPRLPASP